MIPYPHNTPPPQFKSASSPHPADIEGPARTLLPGLTRGPVQSPSALAALAPQLLRPHTEHVPASEALPWLFPCAECPSC